MNPYTWIPVIATAFNLLIGIYVISRGPRLLVNRLFLALTIALTFWGAGEAMMRAAEIQSRVFWGARIAAIGWCVIGPLFVHFALALTENKRLLEKKTTYLILYAPALVLLALVWSTKLVFEGFSPIYWGNVETGGPLRLVSKLFTVGLLLLGIWILARFWIKAPKGSKRTQIAYVTSAALIPITMGIVVDLLLPLFGVNPPVSALTVTPLMGIILAYAVTTQGLLSTVVSALGSTIIGSINDTVLAVNTEGIIETANPAAAHLTGYSEEELVGTPSERLFISSAPGKGLADMDRGGDEAVRAVLCASKSGELVPVSVSSSTVRLHSGRTIGSVVIVHDMRDAVRLVQAEQKALAAAAQVRAERDRSEFLRKSREELRSLSEFLEGVIDNIAEPVLIKDRDLKYVYVNRALCDSMNMSREDFTGKSAHDIFPPEAAASFEETDLRVIETGETVETLGVALEDPDGLQHFVRTLKAPIKNDQGQVEFLVIVANDVTEQKHLEKLRLDFIGIAAHELRTPLTSLKLGFELLARETRGTLTPDQQRSLDILSLSIQRLSRLAKNLLDLANMDAGLMQLDRRAVKVEPLLLDAVAMFAGELTEKGLECLVEVEPGLANAFADPSRLAEVMFNLVSNAVKYTDDGTITLAASSGEDGFIEIKVSDTGIGIPSMHRDEIFSRFSKAQNAETAKEGTGLGLSITKAIVEAHGGRIWVESRLDSGSVFHFTVPADRGRLT